MVCLSACLSVCLSVCLYNKTSQQTQQSQPPIVSSRSTTHTTSHTLAPSEDGGKLLKGTLDEEAEQQMFKQAVLDWRKGGSVRPSRGGCSGVSLW